MDSETPSSLNRVENKIQGATNVLKWIVKLPSDVRDAPLVGPDGAVYLKTEMGLLALEGAKGQIRWHIDKKHAYDEPRILNDNSLLTVRKPADDNPKAQPKLLRLDALTGRVKETMNIAGWCSFDTLAIGQDGTMFVPSNSLPPVTDLESDKGRIAWKKHIPLSAFDPKQTKLKWQVKWRNIVKKYTQLKLEKCPLIGSKGTLFCEFSDLDHYDDVTGDSHISALDSSTGFQKWSKIINGVECMSLSSKDSVIITTSEFGATQFFTVHMLDGATGKLKWKRKYVGGCNSIAISKSGIIYFNIAGTPDSTLAIDERTGDKKWVFQHIVNQESSGSNCGSPSVGGDGSVYVVMESLFALGGSTGSVKWEFPPESGRHFTSSPVIAPDGTIYVIANNRYLYAIGGSNQLAVEVSK